MEEKYKIGTISKILGIPAQTLHYYETCGFVTPEKDAQSGYRYYDAWDINFLLDSKYWQSYEFSTSSVETMIHHDSVSEIQSKLANQKEVLLDRLIFYQNLIEQISEEQQRLASLSAHLGQRELTLSPILYYDTYRKNNSYQASGQTSSLPMMEQWIKAFPFVQATFLVDKESAACNSSASLAYWWGFSVTPAKARSLNLDFCSQASFLPARKSIYTVFEASTRNTFSRSLQEQVFTPILKEGFQITDNPAGRLIVRTHEPGNYKRYFEIWVPVA